MKNKNTLAGIAVIMLIIVLGYLVVTANRKHNLNITTVEGVVEAVDRSQVMVDGPTLITLNDPEGDDYVIAVPSMGINLCQAVGTIADISQIAVGDKVEAVGTLDENSRIVPCVSKDHYLRVVGKVMDATYGYQFWYRKGPGGYVVVEANAHTEPDFVTGVRLYGEAKYEHLENRQAASEPPPAIGLRIYDNPSKLQPSVWVDRNPVISNIDLAMGEPAEVVVAGANAVEYLVDGLYRSKVYVIAYDSRIYILSGEYLDQDSSIYQDFAALVDSFAFIPSDSQAENTKINIQVVCESALAYMTFPDSTAADRFVIECINGDHPEVIERYRNETGLEGAAI